MREDGGEEALFWTDMTRQGCAGQYSACVPNASSFALDKSFRIHATPFDGNCVAIYVNGGSLDLIYKTMQCKERLPIVCIGKILNVEPMSRNIPEAPHEYFDVTEFGSNERDKYENCKTDVIAELCSFFFIAFNFKN
jgi:hypothetical protein